MAEVYLTGAGHRLACLGRCDADVSEADWRKCAPCVSGADRSGQVLASNLTYPGLSLFTQTDPYPRVAILPELVFGAIIGTVDLIDCVPLEKVEGQPYANGRCC